MTADLSALIARLEAAEVGSRELDYLIDEVFSEWKNIGGGWASHKVTGERRNNHFDYPDPVTTSLDAALALAERVLPEATHWEVCTPNGSGFTGPYAATISDPRWLDISRDDWEAFTHGEASGRTPALALCIALLRAKQGEG